MKEPTAKSEIKKQIKTISKYIKLADKNRTPTYSETIEQATRIGWERGLSWALTAIILEERGDLKIYLNAKEDKP
jgi:hypothetical protein